MPISTILVYSATGAQGRPAARRFLDAGYRIRVFTRSADNAQDLAAVGADVFEETS